MTHNITIRASWMAAIIVLTDKHNLSMLSPWKSWRILHRRAMSIKVGEILFKQGFIEEQSITHALSIQSLTKKNIRDILVDDSALKKEAFLSVSRLQQTTQNAMNL
jgi:hypothetical protein